MADNRVGNGLTALAGGANGEHVQLVVQMAHEELRRLTARREELVKRITALKQTIAGLIIMFGVSEDFSTSDE